MLKIFKQLLRASGNEVAATPAASSLGAKHRPFGANETQFLRRVVRKGFKVEGNGAGACLEALPHDQNPGLRVVPYFASEEEAAAAVDEARAIVETFGSSHVTAQHRAVYDRQMAHLERPPMVNMQRVTGRDEGAEWIEETQRRAPWGYGSEFDANQLPPTLRLLADRLKTCGEFDLGPLRDVTINLRNEYFFRLDPHLDPSSDGGNVFILGFLSPTVLTLSPIGQVAGLMDQRKVARHSWAPGEDIDCLLEARAVLHLSGDARAKLHHGIRLGMDASELTTMGIEPPAAGAPAGNLSESSSGVGSGDIGSISDNGDNNSNAGAAQSQQTKSSVLYDWWGSAHLPVARAPERLSVVFAFAEPGELFTEETQARTQ